MWRRVTQILALACLGGCLASPVLFVRGLLDRPSLERAFNVCSAGWFVFATVGFHQRAGRPERPCPPLP